jgi:nucleoside-diphosphate-sugar epimerase
LAAEQLLLSRSTKASVTILRLPSLYGAGQENSFIDGLAQRAVQGETIELFGKGEIVRDALHVSDAVEALVSCIRKERGVGKQILNLGCGRRIRSSEYVEVLVEALGSSSQIRAVNEMPSQIISQYADISAAKEAIGFSPMPLTVAMQRYANELFT